MEEKSSTQTVRFFNPMFAKCNHVSKRCCVHVWKISLKTLKCSSGHVEGSFDNAAENFSPKTEKNCSKSESNYNIIIFSKKNIFFLKKYLLFEETIFKRFHRFKRHH